MVDIYNTYTILIIVVIVSLTVLCLIALLECISEGIPFLRNKSRLPVNEMDHTLIIVRTEGH